MRIMNVFNEEEDDLPDDDAESVFGSKYSVSALALPLRKNTRFSQPHMPVRQLLRRDQSDRVRSLVEARAMSSLKYLTVSGADLWDIRSVAQACLRMSCMVEFMGFGQPREHGRALDSDDDRTIESRDTSEAMLHHGKLVSPNSVTITDPIQDIIIESSHAKELLSEKGVFDVVNFDLGESVSGETPLSELDGMSVLRQIFLHQRSAIAPWLLFITARIDRVQNVEQDEFRAALNRNLDLADPAFDASFSSLLGVPGSELRDAVNGGWDGCQSSGVQLYALGLGKYLLQLAHAQVGDRSIVELESCATYAMDGQAAKVLCWAFKVVPGPKILLQPQTGGQLPTLDRLEPALATRIADQVRNMGDMSRDLLQAPGVLQSALGEINLLIDSTNYDRTAYSAWLTDMGLLRQA